ncbi:hypothetical protein THAOC_36262 [Thalassiosira oceanica]|uniref:Cation efflux protein cytoplasmic domain-containing protein n=1 Tax=Thalassiosira oceanica TaxID=159749 RepID=K0QZN2_THAOC|nr:hypothetical protein THAOC_36262 [Thalassiosira oceanica]|eukprot:EJK45143.1 hypothetical protein THAOC_36262 [Thalassiosira oceanica]
MPPNEQHTFGLKRTESLAALFSMVTLVILSIGLAIEALRRMWLLLFVGAAVAVDGKLMSSIAGLGVVVNIVLALVLGEDHAHLPGHDHSHGHGSHENDHESEGHSHSHHDEESALLDTGVHKKKTKNVNLHAAYLHVLADLAQSVLVFIAGLIIYWKPSWQLVDPICTLVFSVLVCYSTVGVIKSSLSVLLEEVPAHLNFEELHQSICNVKGVTNVHDLHIWSIAQDKASLTCHAIAENPESAYNEIKAIANRKGIHHITLQLQPASMGTDCVTCDGVGCFASTHGDE